MTLALRQSESSRADAEQWIGIEEAASLSGISVGAWRYRARREADAAPLVHRTSLARLGPPLGGKGRPCWYVNRALDDRLSPSRTTRDAAQAREALCGKYPQHLVERAWKRKDVLDRWRKACLSSPKHPARELAVKIVAEARIHGSEGFAVSVRSLYRWQHAFRKSGIEGLVDRYGANPAERVTRSPEAVAWFYELYHTQTKPTITTCHEATLAEAKRRGCNWPASESATRSWLEAHDNLSVTCLMREGRTVWAKRFLPHVSIDYTTIEPGFMYVADHVQLDLWCSYKGVQIRPWVTDVMDARSRTIVGWWIGPTPHSDSIIAALRRAFANYAVPHVLKVDCGKDFNSKSVTGVTKAERVKLRRTLGKDWQRQARKEKNLVDCGCDPRWLGVTGELGIDLSFTTPYAPWAKLIERFHRTLHNQFDKQWPTYCGRSVLDRPECLEAIRRGYTDEQKRRLKRQYGKAWKRAAILKVVDQSAVPTLDEIRQAFGEWLDVYHRTEHGGQGMNGRTPLAVWRTASAIRKASDEALMFLCDVRGIYKVGGNGVSFKVGAGTLSYGEKSAALKRYSGRSVLIAMDPLEVSHCYAFTPDRDKRRLIGRLDCNVSVPPYSTADDVREVIADKMRERSVMHKAGRSAARRTMTLSTRLREQTRTKRQELLATGTDDVGVTPRIVPVATGFEGVSRPDRTHVENVPSGTDWADGIDDLLDDEAPTLSVAPFDSAGMEDLFDDDEPGDGQAGEGLDGL